MILQKTLNQRRPERTHCKYIYFMSTFISAINVLNTLLLVKLMPVIY